jgi:ATP-dependent helicase YprA (DUF1998 family)
MLRFAITLDQADRATALAVAEEMDHGRPPTGRSGFAFFVRTSVQLCDAMIARNCPENIATFRVFLGRIDHLPLRRAFEAVLDIKPSRPNRRDLLRRSRENLWRGLPIRGTEPASNLKAPQSNQVNDTLSSGSIK